MTRIWLFISALAPALLVVGFRLVASHRFIGIALFALATVAILTVFFILKARSSVVPRLFVISESRDETQQVPTYLLTFIVPFLFVDINDWGNAAAYSVLIVLIAILLYRTDLSLVNPALLALGYHIYSIRDGGGHESLIVSRTRPRVGASIAAVPLSGHIYKVDVNETERMNE